VAGLQKKCLLLLMTAVLAVPAMAARAQDTSRPTGAVSSQTSSPESEVPAKKEQEKDENEQYRHSPMVAKMGKMMGMSTEKAATVATIFNFLIFAIAVGYGLLKLLPKTFRNRTSTIQKQLVDARTATEEATARLNSVEARLSKLDGQIAGMRDQARADSERDEKRIQQTVEDEKAKILAAAEAEIVSATAMARREIQQYAAELAIEQAARKLIVTAETDRLLVESFAHRLGADNGETN
jgi:F-type H+-transporting ATPase subunit b